MTTRERREEYSTNVVRVLHPSRPLSPANAEFDNNLEYLLDDLQQSVSRPGSSLGQNAATSYSTSSRDVQYLSPQNTTTVPRERSLSPNIRDGQKVYKTAKYEYSTTSGGGGGRVGSNDMQENIHQLDTLLDDLKHEREFALEHSSHNTSLSNAGIDSGLLEPGSTTRVIKTTYTTNTSGTKPVQRELVFDSPANTVTKQTRVGQKSPGYQKTIESSTLKDVAYDSYIPEKLDSSTTSTITRNYNKSMEPIPFNETVTVDTTSGPLALRDIPLESDILPRPATKVTTTVRTYTYEIPADAPVPAPGWDIPASVQTLPPGQNKTVIYKNEKYNTTTNTMPIGGYPERDILVSSAPPPANKTVIYRNETYNTTNTVDYPDGGPVTYPTTTGQPKYPSPGQPIEPPINKTIVYKKDVRETTTNRYPAPYDQYPPTHDSLPRGQPVSPQNTTVIYKHDVKNTTNTNIHPPPPGGVQVYPSHPNEPLVSHPPGPGGPHPPGGPTTTYYYKHESTNTTNTKYGPPGSGLPPNDRYALPSPPHDVNNYPPSAGYPSPGGPPRRPNEPTTVTYKYSTHSKTNTTGFPDDSQPLLHPAPFPIDGEDPIRANGYPPKRLGELMANFGDSAPPQTAYHDGQLIEKPYALTKDSIVETASSADTKVPTKNIEGPPVYYPPGHELSLKSEQSGAAWRAQGGYAKGSGKYMYESESKSKMKSSSGAAVVPVCCPLCCAMPCSIM